MSDERTPFTQTLREIDYQEDSLRELLGISDVPLLKPQDMASYLQRCQKDNSQRALAACLWLLTLNVRRQEVEELFGEEMVRLLLERDYLQSVAGERLKARVDLYPCLGVQVFTDPVLATEFRHDHVYQLGTDSYVLARVTPRLPGDSALDLCTGSGVHALLAARHHERVVGIDLNPRALDFSRWNASLNGLESRCQFLEGDLYAPVQGQKFDLITANPPFVPTPEKDMQLHRGVGETGEEVPQQIVWGLPDFLAPGGTLSMVLDYPILEQSTYLERLNLWLSRGHQKTPVAGWGVAVTHFATESREEYIKNHLDASDPTQYFANYTRYLASYDRVGIQAIGFANVFIRRLSQDHPGFAVLRPMAIPMHDQSETIDRWLRALTRIHDPAFPSQFLSLKPAPSPRLKAIWSTQPRDRGLFEFQDQQWSRPLYGDRWALELACLADGQAPVRDLIARASQALGVEADQVHQEFLRALPWLLENLILLIH